MDKSSNLPPFTIGRLHALPAGLLILRCCNEMLARFSFLHCSGDTGRRRPTINGEATTRFASKNPHFFSPLTITTDCLQLVHSFYILPPLIFFFIFFSLIGLFLDS